MRYVYRKPEPKREPVVFWEITALVFMLVSLVLGFVAVHNSRPIKCDDVYIDKHNDGKYCLLRL